MKQRQHGYCLTPLPVTEDRRGLPHAMGIQIRQYSIGHHRSYIHTLELLNTKLVLA